MHAHVKLAALAALAAAAFIGGAMLAMDPINTTDATTKPVISTQDT